METIIKDLRKNTNVGIIWFGLEYEAGYIFVVSPHDKFIPGDTEVCYIIVDENGGFKWFKHEQSIYNYIMENREKIIYIDVVEQDLSRVK